MIGIILDNHLSHFGRGSRGVDCSDFKFNGAYESGPMRQRSNISRPRWFVRRHDSVYFIPNQFSFSCFEVNLEAQFSTSTY